MEERVIEGLGRGAGISILLLLSAFFLRAQSTQPPQTTTVGETPQQLKQLSLEDLMQLDVTSVSKQPQPYAEAPASIDVVTSDDISRAGASSIPEALRLADNLQVARVSSSQWAISARGFNNNLANKLLVLIDGRTIYTPLYGGVFWDAQDYLMADIDRMEVISGPGGTLWGANAVNGVINITTKSAQDTQGLYLEAGGGNELQAFTGIRYGTTLASNVYFRAYAKYFERGAELETDGAGAGDSWQRGQTGFRTDWQASSQNLLTLQGDFYEGDEGTAAPAGGVTGDTRIGGGNVLGRFTHSFSEDADLTVQVYFDETHRNVAESYEDDLGTYDLDIQDRFSLGDRNRIVWGGGYRFTDDRFANTPEIALIPAHLDQNLFNAFAQDEITLAPALHWTMGTKVEHNDYTGFEFEPNVRLSWNVTDGQMLWGAVSRAVREPSRVDESLYSPGTPPYFLAGGSNFVSETVIAYELGYRAQLNPKLSTSLCAYYNDYDNVRSLTPPAAPGQPYYIQNNLEGNTYGMEAGGTYQLLDWWRLHAGYDLIKEYLHPKPGTVNTDEGENYDPQQQASLRSTMDLIYNIQFEVEPRWVDKLYNTEGSSTDTTPAYFELNARLAWRASSHLEFSVVGQNLLHAEHQEFGFPASTGEEIERSVYGKVTWQY